MVRAGRFRAHAIIDRKDKEVEKGRAGAIIKRSQSVTHRLLSAKHGGGSNQSLL